MRRVRLSAAEARRVAIAAQGLDRPRPSGAPDIRHVRRVIDTLGLLQLDFVNVLVPAHNLVLYSRLGAYDPERLRRVVYGRGEYIEQWAHEASIVPIDAWPLLDYRRRAFRPWPNSPIMRLRNHKQYLAQVIQIVEEKGPVTAQDLPPGGRFRRRPGDWHRSVPRWALEVHFGQGRLAVADRLPNFQRVYDLPGRVLPGDVAEREVAPADARRELLRRAARACGIATAADLADYYRMPVRDAAAGIDALAAEGALHAVEVEGWSEPGWLYDGARLPRAVDAAALVSPFDPLVWHRPRAERLYDFHYRIEIYVPAHRRRWGYYVLPFLLGDRLAARVDLKAERRDAALLVRAAHAEPHADPGRTAKALARELRDLARWLGLETLRVERRGDLAAALDRAVSA